MRASAGASLNDVMTGVTHLPMSESGSAGLGGAFGLWSVKSGLFGNGLSLNAAYDGDGRLASLGAAFSGSGAAVQALSFSYDLASNITSIADGVTPSRSQTFQYDSLNRLTDAVGVYGTKDWSYDLVGNRTLETSSAGTRSYSDASSSNRLTQVAGAGGTRVMSYAASGQLTADTKNGTSFVNVHDDAGRLIEAKADGATLATYSYDAFEQRVSKTTTAAAPGGASSVHFSHDQFGRLIAEHDGSNGAPLREYLWLGLMPVAFIDHSSGSAVTYYLHVDQVMNPQKLTNTAGAIVWDRVQDPFGVEVSATGSLTLPSRFPGQYADIESGFNQNWNRDYDPSLGRYVQSDPIGLMGGINTYAYVEGNPVARVDPDGLLAAPLGA